ncbi:MAG: hypothetical protein AAGF74_15720 [Pseudomonadota bacterium]
MAQPMKIATCCYCGTRAALVLDKRRHELTCSACGAPLHDMKSLRKDAKTEDGHVGHWFREDRADLKKRKGVKKKKKKKREPLWKKVIEEAFDVVEDVFD